jgi:hypothetical protein
MKTIDVTDEMYDFLMDLSKELNTQDHRCTAMPYFFQVKTTKEIPTGEGMGDEVWVCDGEICLRDDDDAVFEYNEWDLKNVEHLKKYNDLLEYEIDELLENNYRKCYVTTKDVYENAFLTEKACRKHIEANHYHYSDPKDYLQYAFRNPELEKVMEFICSLSGGSLHK